jgi:hypothetical protein
MIIEQNMKSVLLVAVQMIIPDVPSGVVVLRIQYSSYE